MRSQKPGVTREGNNGGAERGGKHPDSERLDRGVHCNGAWRGWKYKRTVGRLQF